jgi:YD repeat-containing protein
MHIEWTHRTPDGRSLAVVYDDGTVTVTDPDGDAYRLTYTDGRLTGSRLAQSHRTAIAAHIAANLAASAVGL